MKFILLISFFVTGQVIAFIPSYNLGESLDETPDIKVIYGSDDRREPQSTNFSNYNIENGKRATAALIHRYNLEDYDINRIILNGPSLEHELNVCPDEKFSDQMAVANCSGVLVGPNLLLTASHCILGREKDFCNHYRWVFDYTSDSDFIPKESVYKCTDVLESHYNSSKGIDWALIALDRIVEDRPAVNIRTTGKPNFDSKLVMMGYPSGLPLKVTLNGEVREINQHFIKTNFDSFSGNSGSPVFNIKSGLLEGILIRGEQDYEYDSKSGCLRPLKCEQEGCSGEDITMIGSMYNLKRYIKSSTK